MISASSLQRLFGIKNSETRTAGLFLMHYFLLGIGSVLVYVAANVLLLEHHPEQSLPLGYTLGAGAMVTRVKGTPTSNTTTCCTSWPCGCCWPWWFSPELWVCWGRWAIRWRPRGRDGGLPG
ncbi:hypothetical protein IC235_21110 [Hymenobacter sp. BT664]|uniref:Uncharacterized protein n=1 Tax=Hymenobacter montanus TaxID=2771359 RepID=A0A927GL84_9BACT|nr:hypothetical protein [Hymenobacter montanus]MBD2770393.1 hypothetical protein [Hymenobacter montanus]